MTNKMFSLGYDPIIRDIPDYPNYQISENGEVYNKITGKELKHLYRPNGYAHFDVNVGDKRGHKKHISIHRILAEIFIPNPLNKPYVDHIDRDRTNNRVSNLRWATNSENQTNTKVPTSNKSGTIGVCCKFKEKKHPYWFGHIGKLGKNYEKNFPYTDEGLEQAKQWRKEMEEKLHIFE